MRITARWASQVKCVGGQSIKKLRVLMFFFRRPRKVYFPYYLTILDKIFHFWQRKVHVRAPSIIEYQRWQST